MLLWMRLTDWNYLGSVHQRRAGLRGPVSTLKSKRFLLCPFFQDIAQLLQRKFIVNVLRFLHRSNTASRRTGRKQWTVCSHSLHLSCPNTDGKKAAAELPTGLLASIAFRPKTFLNQEPVQISQQFRQCLPALTKAFRILNLSSVAMNFKGVKLDNLAFHQFLMKSNPQAACELFIDWLQNVKEKKKWNTEI